MTKDYFVRSPFDRVGDRNDRNGKTPVIGIVSPLPDLQLVHAPPSLPNGQQAKCRRVHVPRGVPSVPSTEICHCLRTGSPTVDLITLLCLRGPPSVLEFLSHFVITPLHNSTHAVTSDVHNPWDDVFYRTNQKRLYGVSIR